MSLFQHDYGLTESDTEDFIQWLIEDPDNEEDHVNEPCPIPVRPEGWKCDSCFHFALDPEILVL